MAVRSTMASLIERTRRLINDPAGTAQAFDDQDVQDALDLYQLNVRYEPLTALETVLPGGVVQYLIWQSPHVFWETGAQVYDPSWSALTPSASDLLAGQWTFATHQVGVTVTGAFYDVYAACADLLETWAAKSARAYDFSTDSERFARSQMRAGLLEAAKTYRRRQLPRFGQIVRSDVTG